MAGYVSGGWQGAIAGAVVGGAVGFVAPWASEEVGAAAGAGIAGMLAQTGTAVGLGAANGAAATMLGNEISNLSSPPCKQKSLTKGIGFGIALGALAPLMSGEAFVIGAGGETAVGAATVNAFSGITGGIGVIGSAMDPEASHGFLPSEPSGSDSCTCK